VTPRVLQTNTDDLRDLATKLGGHAEAASKIDPSTGPHDAAAAMPNTLFGTACTAVADPIMNAYRGVAGQVQQMAKNAANGAGSYDATEAAFGAQLKQYEAGAK
jgi:hypothetical protein